jgi:tRNA modification GTPase
VKPHLTDTIVAIATPLGEGAISIVRLSGKDAITIAAKRFKGKKNLQNAKSHSAHVGRIVDVHDCLIDEVVGIVYREPSSYSGENIVEINCHGGIQVTKKVLQCFVDAGARLAEPGEFTKRAFLNHKMDLSEAEAVAALITARSQKAHNASLKQLNGTLSNKIIEIRTELIRILGLLELQLDFVEEDVDFIDKKTFSAQLAKTISEIENFIDSYNTGKLWREGVHVALIGAPNAGKSSVLNTLLNEERAIVSHIPGTTRDFIEENILIDGLLFKLTDTAGLRETVDAIEKEGVERAKEIARSADIIVLVHDSTVPFSELEKKILSSKSGIIALNKIDLLKKEFKASIPIDNWDLVRMSALENTGLDNFKKLLASKINGNSLRDGNESFVITNERHYLALQKAKLRLSEALQSNIQGQSNEFVAVDLRSAIDSVGEIVGHVTSEDILNSVFSKFCIGK